MLQSTGEEEHFSDDSLEDMPPPPPPPDMVEHVEAVSKRGSIAWEVPLDQDPEDPCEDPAVVLTPGSTKVVGRRRRRQSTENYSSELSPGVWCSLQYVCVGLLHALP